MPHASSRRLGEGPMVRRRNAGANLMPSLGRFEIATEVLDAVH
jgi:hypothetical protein